MIIYDRGVLDVGVFLPREQWPAQRRSAPVGGGGHGGVLLSRRRGHGDGGAPGLGGQGAVGRRGGAGGLHSHAADDEDGRREVIFGGWVDS